MLPLKYITLTVYCLLTQFERPDWCLDIIYEKEQGNIAYADWNDQQCNDPDENYTNWNLPKFRPSITIPI